MYANVHNIFIDHVDHSAESNQHHHHGDGDDILIHYDDECNNNDETAVTIHYGFGSNHVLYGPAKHTHDDNIDIIDTSRLRSPERRAVNVLTSTALNINNDYNVDWDGNDDNVTGGYPNKSNPT